MILDNSWLFSSAQAVLTSTTLTASTTAVDLLGVGSGTAPNATFGNATKFGQDLGPGGGYVPTVYININANFATTNSAALTIQFQGAPDSGSNTAGTYTTYAELPAIPAAALITNNAFTLKWPDVLPVFGSNMPRFIRLNYQCATGTNWTTGTITASLVEGSPDRWVAYPGGFTVA